MISPRHLKHLKDLAYALRWNDNELHAPLRPASIDEPFLPRASRASHVPPTAAPLHDLPLGLHALPRRHTSPRATRRPATALRAAALHDELAGRLEHPAQVLGRLALVARHVEGRDRARSGRGAARYYSKYYSEIQGGELHARAVTWWRATWWSCPPFFPPKGSGFVPGELPGEAGFEPPAASPGRKSAGRAASDRVVKKLIAVRDRGASHG